MWGCNKILTKNSSIIYMLSITPISAIYYLKELRYFKKTVPHEPRWESEGYSALRRSNSTTNGVGG
jgi:hypothetical protein